MLIFFASTLRNRSLCLHWSPVVSLCKWTALSSKRDCLQLELVSQKEKWWPYLDIWHINVHFLFFWTPLAICNTHKETGSRSGTRRALMRMVDGTAPPSDTELQPLELDGQWLPRNANYLKYPRRDNWEDCIGLDRGESAEKQWELSEMSSEQFVRVQTGLLIPGTNNVTLEWRPWHVNPSN